MDNLKALFKFIIFGVFVVSYFISTMPFYLYAKFNRYKARKYLIRLMQFHARLTLKLLGIEPKIINYNSTNQFGKLIIGNHLSYIDVLVMASHFQTCFVTSIEMKNTPFLGQLCEAGGCLYVERRTRKNLSQEIMDITMALQAGLNVVIFPEATSTNGEEVKRFKRPLFQAAIDSGVEILPVILNYKTIDFDRVSQHNRDTVFWYGEMSFLPHFWNLLKCSQITIELNLADNIVVHEEDNVTELAAISHFVVKSHYRPIQLIQ